jgi:hypothetical protein
MFVYIFFLPYNFFSGFFSNLTIFLFIWWLIIGKKKGYFLKVKEDKKHPFDLLLEKISPAEKVKLEKWLEDSLEKFK